ncbi:MAG: hypothetical protein MJ071_00990 [Oscillospiraceae bacterium]|nr:hypothetical protein [Oscillospiraceae bacterium]
MKQVLGFLEKLDKRIETLHEAREEVAKYPGLTSENYKNIDNLINRTKPELQRLADEHRKLRDELREVTDSLSIIEQVTNRTYVMQLREQRILVDASQNIVNGFARGNER